MFSFDILTDALFEALSDVLAGFAEERLASNLSYELTDGRMDELTDGRMDGWTDGSVGWETGDDSGRVREAALGETDNPLHFLLDVSKTMGVGMTV